MSAINAINTFEKNLESVIKGVFSRDISANGDFEIAADFDTHSRVNDIVEGLGLAVYGMSVTPSEFIITFEFIGLYETIDCKEKPSYCNIKLKNDGDYYLSISEDETNENWYLSVTDVHFNTKLISDEIIIEAMNEFEKVLMATAIS